jgi:phospho-N-acetylmuramoyl-pentapeptide-transferase
MMYLIYQKLFEGPSPLVHSYPWLEAFNVFKYQTFRAPIACILAFLICVTFGDAVIRKLLSLKLGQPIRSAEEVHKLNELHGKKAGTPTMGGVLLLGSVVITTLVCASAVNYFVWTVLFVMISLGALGFMDDYAKVTKKSSDGISARAKMLGQLSVALIAGAFLYYGTDDTTQSYMGALYVPFLKTPVIEDMGVFSLVFFAIVIVGCSNAVNLTDGLDGLATGCTVTVAMAYAVFTYVAGKYYIAREFLFIPHHEFAGELCVICAALVGAGLGFLWFNCHPAKVFMGDTGSLSLGGTIGIIAICCKQEIVLVLVGGIFVAEAMSVILQVGSFKLRGKRIFRMSPIHHHFELGGWHESQVINRFWIVSLMLALAGLATLKLR